MSRFFAFTLLLLSFSPLFAGVILESPAEQTLSWEGYTLTPLGQSVSSFDLVQVSFEARCTELESATDYDQVFFTVYPSQPLQLGPQTIIGQEIAKFTMRITSTDWQTYTYLLKLSQPISQMQMSMISEVYNPEIRDLRVATVHYETVELWSETFHRLEGVGTPEEPISLKTEKDRIPSIYTDIPGWKYFDMNRLYEEAVLKEVPVSACGRPAVLTEMQVALQTPYIATLGEFDEITIEFDLHADDISEAPATEECTWVMVNYTDNTGSPVKGTGVLSPYNYTSPDGWSHCTLTVTTKGVESFYARLAPCGYDALYMTNFHVTGRKLVADGATPDAVSASKASTDEQTFFDLNGRRQTKLQKGINIVGGKKILK